MLVSKVHPTREGTQPLPHLELLLHVLFVDQSGDGFHLVHAVQIVFQLGDLPVRVQPRLAAAVLIGLVVVLIISIIEFLWRIDQAR